MPYRIAVRRFNECRNESVGEQKLLAEKLPHGMILLNIPRNSVGQGKQDFLEPEIESDHVDGLWWELNKCPEISSRISRHAITCPGASLIHSAGLAAHVKGVTAIEANSRQYCPNANAAWAPEFPGIFDIKHGQMQTGSLTGLGLGATP